MLKHARLLGAVGVAAMLLAGPGLSGLGLLGAQEGVGVDVAAPLPATGPGGVIVHNLTLTNTTAERQTWRLEPGSAAWAVLPPADEIVLDGGARATVPVTVAVPLTAANLEIDTVSLRIVRGAPATGAVTVALTTWTGGEYVDGRYVGCRFDLTRDGVVDRGDVARVVESYNAEPPSDRYDAVLDLDHDGRVGAADVQAVAGHVGTGCGPLTEVDTTALREAMSVPGVLEHLEALQSIADDNGGNRAAGTPGYQASVDYVAGRLRDAGFEVDVPTFTYRVYEVLGEPLLARVAPEPVIYGEDDALLFYLSGSGPVTATVQAVDVVVPPGPAPDSSNSGCEPVDFQGFEPGNIALVQRGTCPFRNKIANAIAAGAAGVVIFNEGQDRRTGVITSSAGQLVDVPIFGASYAVGEALVGFIRGGQAVTLSMDASTQMADRPSYNVIAEWPRGRADRVVFTGAHLDSVGAGPGMNDNASGSAAVLELALQVAATDLEPVNRMRFGWWGAEERGLLGSRAYVEDLTPVERDDILLYLNFDMIGSPNYIRAVYDGDGSDARVAGPPGSDEIEALFVRYLTGQGLTHEPVDIVGASDHGPFGAVGIPYGGLFTGAGSRKTEAQVDLYGGQVDVAHDPCYHQPCDTLDGINDEVLDQMIDAAAHAAQTLAMDAFLPLTSGRARSALGAADIRALALDHAYVGDHDGHLVHRALGGEER